MGFPGVLIATKAAAVVACVALVAGTAALRQTSKPSSLKTKSNSAIAQAAAENSQSFSTRSGSPELERQNPSTWPVFDSSPVMITNPPGLLRLTPKAGTVGFGGGGGLTKGVITVVGQNAPIAPPSPASVIQVPGTSVGWNPRSPSRLGSNGRNLGMIGNSPLCRSAVGVALEEVGAFGMPAAARGKEVRAGCRLFPYMQPTCRRAAA
jgi:hypothetical protein